MIVRRMELPDESQLKVELGDSSKYQSVVYEDSNFNLLNSWLLYYDKDAYKVLFDGGLKTNKEFDALPGFAKKQVNDCVEIYTKFVKVCTVKL